MLRDANSSARGNARSQLSDDRVNAAPSTEKSPSQKREIVLRFDGSQFTLLHGHTIADIEHKQNQKDGSKTIVVHRESFMHTGSWEPRQTRCGLQDLLEHVKASNPASFVPRVATSAFPPNGPASGAGTRSLEELVTLVMGTFKECIFKDVDIEYLLMMLAALYPPANSVPDKEHDNDTSTAIERVLANRN